MTGEIGSFYDQQFYEEQMADSLKAARVYLGHLWKFMQPESVADIGCGRGTWLKACGELGSARLYGLDGPWNRQELMIEPQIVFRDIDLNQRFSAERVDLAMSLEVAEHLKSSAAAGFVAALTDASDCVLFGAAYRGQGGTNHVNEQPQSYWAGLFAGHGHVPFDLFRPIFWADERVPYWYRQNTFLYVLAGSASHQRLTAAGQVAIDPSFTNCVHPELFNAKLQELGWLRSESASFKAHVRGLWPSLARSARRRLRIAEPQGPAA